MLDTTLQIIEHIVLPLGGMGVFLAEFIEEVIVPIPSVVILLGSGFIFLNGPITPEFVRILFGTIVIPATLGLTLGSLVLYTLAYYGGKAFLDRFGKWISITWKDVDDLNTRLSKTEFEEISIIVARIIPVVPSVLLAVFGGVTRMPVKKYIVLTLIGAFFRTIILALIGWQVGEVYLRYAGIISRFENLIMILVVVIIIGFIIIRKYALMKKI